MSDAEKIAREVTTHLQSHVHTDVDSVMRRHVWLDSEAARSAITEALLAAEARGYAAAREQAAGIVGDRAPATQDMTSTFIAEALDESAAAIRKMEPNT